MKLEIMTKNTIDLRQMLEAAEVTCQNCEHYVPQGLYCMKGQTQKCRFCGFWEEAKTDGQM